MNIQNIRNSQIEIKPSNIPIQRKESAGTMPGDSISIGNNGNEDPGVIKLNILHMNDVHGAVEPTLDPTVSEDSPVGGIAYSAAIIEQEKAKNPEGTLTLNAGDIAEGTMVSYMTKGRIISDTMKQIKFDAIALGNHDFEWGQEALGTIVQDLDAPVVAANVVKTSDGSVIDGAKPYIMKDIKGVKVAIIGLDTCETERYIEKEKLEGLRFENEIDTAKKYVPEVKDKGADLVVVLSHLGFDADKELASKVDGIDVIVGGHSHTELPEGFKQGETIIVQAGSQSRYVGNLELQIDPNTKKIIQNQAKLIPVITKDLQPDKQVMDILTPFLQDTERQGNQVMGTATEDLHYGHKDCKVLNQIFADSILDASGAEIGLCSSRILRGNVKAGEVPYKELYSALPFTSEKFYTVKTTGDKVLEEIESRIVDGGRGISVPAGFKYEYDPSLPEGRRVTSATLSNGAPLDPEKEYTVVLNSSTVTRKSFTEAKEKQEKGECQKVFFEAFGKGSPWTNSTDGRVRTVTGGAIIKE